MTLTPTPRTDSVVTGNSDPSQDEYEDLAYFARTLERELTTAIEAYDYACAEKDKHDKYWHDLAQERIVAQRAAESALAAALETLAAAGQLGAAQDLRALIRECTVG